MALSFQHKISLKHGSAVFYHEGALQSGEVFHVLIVVPGERVEEYFQYIGAQEDLPIKNLETYGEILHCATGSMSEDDINAIFSSVLYR